MINRIFYFFTVIFLIFVFVIFYRGLNNSNLYTPNTDIKKIPEFTSKTLIKKDSLNSKDIFNQNKFYLLNIWSSWCVPCRDEHPLLMNLSNKEKIEIIGLNYKDNPNNAEKFINELGNPYSVILIDRDGTKAIEWGAFGVPENFLIYENKIIKRYIGPLNSQLIDEIKSYIE
jgi:cytochrome c biogenesis protein CcmG, thiol:disulfide interchange protein DsbE